MSGNSIVVLTALTKAYIGVGYGGIIDNPIYKNNYGLVVIPSTSIKGAMKKRYGEKVDELVFFDAWLTFLPAPSNNGILFLTSPALLWRLSEITGMPDEGIITLGECAREDTVYVDTYYRASNPVYIETFAFRRIVEPALDMLHTFLKYAAQMSWLKNDEFSVGLVNDTTYRILLKRLITVLPRIKISGFENKNVPWRGGVEIYRKNVELGPWYEERIPQMSVFISRISGNFSFPGYISIGGRESLGCGMFYLNRLNCYPSPFARPQNTPSAHSNYTIGSLSEKNIVLLVQQLAPQLKQQKIDAIIQNFIIYGPLFNRIRLNERINEQIRFINNIRYRICSAEASDLSIYSQIFRILEYLKYYAKRGE